MSPDEGKQPESEEMASLNADSLDIDQLDERALEDVAGGHGGRCGTYRKSASD